MIAKNPNPNQLRIDTQGVVYVEFLLVFLPLFTLFLFILQFAILAATDLGVRHAAAGAARSAIVILPDDPADYPGSLKNTIDYNSSCSEGFLGKLSKLVKKIGINTQLVPDDGNCPGGPRMDDIRFTAIMRMLPFSPNPGSFLPSFGTKLLGKAGKAGWLAGAAVYGYGATGVTFPNSNDSDGQYVFGPGPTGDTNLNEAVTVRVTYMAYCGIPIARYLMCDSSYSLISNTDIDGIKDSLSKLKNADSFQDLIDIKDANEKRKVVRDRLERAQSKLNDLATGVGNRYILTALHASGERFMLLDAEATLPLNAASYQYVSEKEDSEEVAQKSGSKVQNRADSFEDGYDQLE